MKVLEQICTCGAAGVCCSLLCFKMSLYRFFKPVNKKFLDPNGELSATISLAAIREANQEVMEVNERGEKKPYTKISDLLRAKVAHYTLHNGNAIAVHKFSKEFDVPLNESTVRSLKKSYIITQETKRERQVKLM